MAREDWCYVTRPVLRAVLSAGLEATALRQAGCPPPRDSRAAQAAAYAAVEKIHSDGAHFRRDVAVKVF
jgi:hypothetical protein